MPRHDFKMMDGNMTPLTHPSLSYVLQTVTDILIYTLIYITSLSTLTEGPLGAPP